MQVAVGCDHAGFPMKSTVIKSVESCGHSVIDCGTNSTESCDYPVFARRVGEAMLSGKAERGIVICGSGVGAAVAANKIPGIRACVCHDLYSAAQGVEHDDMNVLCLGARVIDEGLAAQLVKSFLDARFTNEERHLRRLNLVLEIERDALAGKFGPARQVRAGV